MSSDNTTVNLPQEQDPDFNLQNLLVRYESGWYTNWEFRPSRLAMIDYVCRGSVYRLSPPEKTLYIAICIDYDPDLFKPYQHIVGDQMGLVELSDLLKMLQERNLIQLVQEEKYCTAIELLMPNQFGNQKWHHD